MAKNKYLWTKADSKFFKDRDFIKIDNKFDGLHYEKSFGGMRFYVYLNDGIFNPEKYHIVAHGKQHVSEDVVADHNAILEFMIQFEDEDQPEPVDLSGKNIVIDGVNYRLEKV